MALSVVPELAETLKNSGPIQYAKSTVYLFAHKTIYRVHIFYKCIICHFKHIILLCSVFVSCLNVLLLCVMCVTCRLCPIVVLLPPGYNPIAVK
jgi:hypothetical protein